MSQASASDMRRRPSSITSAERPTAVTPLPGIRKLRERTITAPDQRAPQPASNSRRATGQRLAQPGKVVSAPSEPPRLSQFITNAHQQSRQWESATVIVDRIIKNKASVAPTSVMSIQTRALISRKPSVLRWNDATYGYLPWFTAQGKIQAVRELLRAGCNPGTKAKPRWAPVYNAIRGASEKHIKCLMALLSHGANANASHGSNGKSLLHYAIEVPLWSGYSTVIYALLANNANPNVCDMANNIPLMMLLGGDGHIPQEKKDALLLLLAPNYNTSVDVTMPGTHDNPLHLAIRRKDSHTVDAIMTKINPVHGLFYPLMHSRNKAGLTPLLLAFTIFFFIENDVEEELRIVKLLMVYGSNPNDQDETDDNTPLHLLLNASQNTLALELLCRHQANPRINNAYGATALDLVQKRRDTSANPSEDKWCAFAKRRMTNTLEKQHYRPPELTAFLADERTQKEDHPLSTPNQWSRAATVHSKMNT